MSTRLRSWVRAFRRFLCHRMLGGHRLGRLYLITSRPHTHAVHRFTLACECLGFCRQKFSASQEISDLEACVATIPYRDLIEVRLDWAAWQLDGRLPGYGIPHDWLQLRATL